MLGRSYSSRGEKSHQGPFNDRQAGLPEQGAFSVLCACVPHLNGAICCTGAGGAGEPRGGAAGAAAPCAAVGNAVCTRTPGAAAAAVEGAHTGGSK